MCSPALGSKRYNKTASAALSSRTSSSSGLSMVMSPLFLIRSSLPTCSTIFTSFCSAFMFPPLTTPQVSRERFARTHLSLSSALDDMCRRKVATIILRHLLQDLAARGPWSTRADRWREKTRPTLLRQYPELPVERKAEYQAVFLPPGEFLDLVRCSSASSRTCTRCRRKLSGCTDRC